MKIWVSTMTVLLVFGLFVVIATAHNITNLEVPQYGDPRKEARLECHYVNERGDPPLHSVKWYRDNNEIFRFTPDQQPPIRTFNTTTGGTTKGSCTMHNCTITVALSQKYNTRIGFTCEVSTEGPRFAVVKLTKYLTVAVALKKDPVITGAPATVQMNEDVIVNCSTDYAFPPANLMWYIDGKPEKIEPWMSDNTETSAPDVDGLRASHRALRLKIATPRPYVDLRCEATQPVKPPHTRSSSVTIYVARSPAISMFTSASGSMLPEAKILLLVTCMLLHIFSKYSALREV
ncbi:uncharacterized protein LOC126369262 [Pectinophora gossypiella]|uniref:uncharacterized protein LOC126369262 n=1 Tax=Pectinophora gossypiella TaxID=13191 RepID=UPI00214F1D4A|nr:uncharacterized protein LOC126369262 [Pectinophora gossypiella]